MTASFKQQHCAYLRLEAMDRAGETGEVVSQKCALTASPAPAQPVAAPGAAQLDTGDAAMLDWLQKHTNVARDGAEPPLFVYWGDRGIRHAIREAMLGTLAPAAPTQSAKEGEAAHEGAELDRLLEALSEHDDPCEDAADATARVAALRAEIEHLRPFLLRAQAQEEAETERLAAEYWRDQAESACPRCRETQGKLVSMPNYQLMHCMGCGHNWTPEGFASPQQSAPTQSDAALSEVDEATAMKGGRWVSADDIERMAGELVSLATGEGFRPVKMVDAYHTLRDALALSDAAHVGGVAGSDAEEIAKATDNAKAQGAPL